MISQAVEEEYKEVLLRSKFDRFVAVEHRMNIFGAVVIAAERMEPRIFVQECLDPRDDKYPSLAAAAEANVVVSSDKRHLLSMHPWRGISIVSPADFLRLPSKD